MKVWCLKFGLIGSNRLCLFRVVFFLFFIFFYLGLGSSPSAAFVGYQRLAGGIGVCFLFRFCFGFAGGVDDNIPLYLRLVVHGSTASCYSFAFVEFVELRMFFFPLVLNILLAFLFGVLGF